MLSNYLISSCIMATPILLTAMGDLYSEKSGVLNMGLEAGVLLGAYASYHFSYFSGNVYLGLLMAILIGLAAGLLQALLTVTLRCNQVVYGVGANIFALGITGTLYRVFFGTDNAYAVCPGLPKLSIPLLNKLPAIGELFSGLTLLFYIAIVFVVLSSLIFRYTTAGLKIRAAGENPHAADSLGVNVFRIRYGCVMLSNAFAALGGAALTVGDLCFFQDGMSAGRGYLALAAVIFGRYKPSGVLIAALLFGMVDALQMRLQLMSWGIPYQVFVAMPYIVTLVALYVMGASTAPLYNAKPFVRGER